MVCEHDPLIWKFKTRYLNVLLDTFCTYQRRFQKSLDIFNQLQYFATTTSLFGVESVGEHKQSFGEPNNNVPKNLLVLSIV